MYSTLLEKYNIYTRELWFILIQPNIFDHPYMKLASIKFRIIVGGSKFWKMEK